MTNIAKESVNSMFAAEQRRQRAGTHVSALQDAREIVRSDVIEKDKLGIALDAGGAVALVNPDNPAFAKNAPRGEDVLRLSARTPSVNYDDPSATFDEHFDAEFIATGGNEPSTRSDLLLDLTGLGHGRRPVYLAVSSQITTAIQALFSGHYLSERLREATDVPVLDYDPESDPDWSSLAVSGKKHPGYSGEAEADYWAASSADHDNFKSRLGGENTSTILGMALSRLSATGIETRGASSTGPAPMRTGAGAETHSFVASAEEFMLEARGANRRIDRVIVESSDTTTDRNLLAPDLAEIHAALSSGDDERMPWHYVVLRDGRVQRGRPIDDAEGVGDLRVIAVGGLNCPSGTPDPTSHRSSLGFTIAQHDTIAWLGKSVALVLPEAEMINEL